MMRFVVADELPYLLHGNKTYAVRWDEKGFTVGAEVKLASVPATVYSELSMKAKFPYALDSIGKQEETEQTEQEEVPFADDSDPLEMLDAMNVMQLKSFARKQGIDIGEARKKAEIIQAIKDVSK